MTAAGGAGAVGTHRGLPLEETIAQLAPAGVAILVALRALVCGDAAPAARQHAIVDGWISAFIYR